MTTPPATSASDEAVWLFDTRRLRVRRIQPDDRDAMLAVYGDAEAMRWVGDGRPLSREQCEEWIGVTLRNYATRGYGMVAIVERESGQTIGFCGLVHPGGQPDAEIKYALRHERWRQGFATEAAQALLAWGAATWGLHEVVATTAPENKASHHVLLKAGMRRGELRRNGDGSRTQVFVWTAG
jgi:RimJ/RimL family protein N-acetyltransferase